MRLITDENIWVSMTRAFRLAGHPVYSILESQPGIKDEEVLRLAFERNVLLVTADKGYGNMVFRQQLPTSGVLLLRLRELEDTERNNLALRVLEEFGDSLLGQFSVLTTRDLRSKPI